MLSRIKGFFVNLSSDKEQAQRFAFMLCCLYGAFWCCLLTYKYYNFGYYDWDLALYSQGMWNLVHGNIKYTSLFDASFLSNHSNYFSFIISPIYFLFQSSLTLIYLKVFAFSIGAYLFYLIIREKLPLAAFTLLILYFIYPPNIFMLFFEFDYETLAIPFIFAMFLALQKDRYAIFITCAFLACLIKENITLVVTMFGLYALITKKDKKWGVIALIFGLSTFWFFMNVATPFFRRDFVITKNIYWWFYSEWGSTPLEIIKSILSNPVKLFNVVFSDVNKRYLTQLFGPVLLLPVFSPHVLFLGLPLFMQNLLAKINTQHTIFYHYTATLAPFIFLATANTLVALRSKKIIRLVVLVIMFGVSFFNFSAYYLPWRQEVQRWKDGLDPYRWSMIRQIPPGASAIVSFNLLNQVIQRKDLYAIYNFWKGKFYWSGRDSEDFQKPIDYMMIDFGEDWLKFDLLQDPSTVSARIRSLLEKQKMSVISASDDLVLFSKHDQSANQIVKVDSQARLSKEPLFNVNKELNLLDLQIRPVPGQRLEMDFDWQAQKALKSVYFVALNIKKKGFVHFGKLRMVGYAIYPTTEWKSGERVSEKYYYVLPSLAPGDYEFELAFYKIKKSGFQRLKYLEDHAILEGNALRWHYSIQAEDFGSTQLH